MTCCDRKDQKSLKGIGWKIEQDRTRFRTRTWRSRLALCERLEGRLVMPKKSKMVKASDEDGRFAVFRSVS